MGDFMRGKEWIFGGIAPAAVIRGAVQAGRLALIFWAEEMHGRDARASAPESVPDPRGVSPLRTPVVRPQLKITARPRGRVESNRRWNAGP